MVAVLFCLTSFTGCLEGDDASDLTTDNTLTDPLSTADAEELSQKFANLTAKYEALAVDLSNLANNYDQALTKNQELSSELSDAMAELAVFRDDEDEKNSTIAEQEEAIADLKKQLDASDDEIESLRDSVEDWNNSYYELKSEFSSFEDEVEEEIGALQSNFTILEQEYVTLKDSFEKLEDEYQSLESDFDEWKTYQSITVWNIEGDCPTTLHFSYASGIDNGDGEGEAGNGKLENGEIDTEATVCAPGTNSINTSSSSSYIYDITEFDNRLYFRYQDSTYGVEMWVSDGVNMEMFMDINPGDDHSYATPLIVVGSLLYFTADNGIHGRELWATDGTKDGTYMIKDIRSGTSSTYLDSYEIYKDKLYFAAYTSDYGDELWVTDGTEDGTHMVKDIRPGDGSSYVNAITEWNGSLYFVATDGVYGSELWVSDGTEDGTHMVKDIRLGESGSMYGCDEMMGNCDEYELLTGYNGKAYFFANDGEHGNEPWVTDGTKNGTVMVKDIRPGEDGSSYCYDASYGSCFREYNELLFFKANDGEHGYEVWKTDGTEDGTSMLADIRDGSDGSNPNNFFVFNDYLYFRADDGSTTDIWMTDGKQMLMSLEIYPNQHLYMSMPIHFAGEIYFSCSCSSGDGNEFWKSDGTKEGTVMVYDIRPGTSGSSPYYFTIFRDALFFRAYNSSGHEELYVHSPDYWEF